MEFKELKKAIYLIETGNSYKNKKEIRRIRDLLEDSFLDPSLLAEVFDGIILLHYYEIIEAAVQSNNTKSLLN